MNIKKLTLTAMLLTAALVIFIIEAQIPPIVPVPGIKLGLANTITLMTVYILGRKEAFIVLALRIILSSIFAGNFTGFMYSMAGGLLAFAFMSAAAVFLKENRMWAVSVIGAIGHNTGQIIAAVFILKTPQILWYLPILIISAVITGIFTGAAAQTSVKQLRKTKFFKE